MRTPRKRVWMLSCTVPEQTADHWRNTLEWTDVSSAEGLRMLVERFLANAARLGVDHDKGFSEMLRAVLPMDR